MLQRQQSLFLAIIVILSLMVIFFPIARFGDNGAEVMIMKATGLFAIDQAGNLEKIKSFTFLVPADILIIVLGSLAIGLFKNRKLQMKIALILALVCLIFFTLMFFYIIQAKNEFNHHFSAGISLGIPLIILLLDVLAYRGIKKDEDLVKSLDRLR